MSRIAQTLRIGIAGIATAAALTGAASAVSQVAVAAATATPASASYGGPHDYSLWDFDHYFDHHTCDEIHVRQSNEDLLHYLDVRPELRDYLGSRGVVHALYERSFGWNNFSWDCSWAHIG